MAMRRFFEIGIFWAAFGSALAAAQTLGLSAAYWTQGSGAPGGTCSAIVNNGVFYTSNAGKLYQCTNIVTGSFAWDLLGAGTGTGMSGMTAAQVPIAATATTVTSSEALNGSGGGIVTGPTSSTNADCVKFTGTGGQIADSGAACGVGSLSGMTASQVPVAATASTVTSSKALAGSGSGITTGPTSSTTTDCADFTGTGGQIADSGAPCGVGSLSGMTASQVPIAATASTVTSSKALAGSGAGITTGPGSSTSGDCVVFTGTGGQIADAGATCGVGGNGAQQWLLANDSSGGTAANLMAAWVSDSITGNSVVTAPSALGPGGTNKNPALVGVCLSGCGTSGNGTFQFAGAVSWTCDNQTAIGEQVVLSSTTAGECDALVSSQQVNENPEGNSVVGKVLVANSGAGTASTVELVPYPGYAQQGPSAQSGITLNPGQGFALGNFGSPFLSSSYWTQISLGSTHLAGALLGNAPIALAYGNSYGYIDNGIGGLGQSGHDVGVNTLAYTYNKPGFYFANEEYVIPYSTTCSGTLTVGVTHQFYPTYYGNNYTIQLTGNCTIPAPTADNTGEILTMEFTPPGSGGPYAVTWNAVFLNAPVVSLSSGGTPVSVSFYFDGTDYTAIGDGFPIAASLLSGQVSPAHGGTGADNSAATGVQQWSSGTQSVSAALANGTTATTQAQGDATTDAATDAFVQNGFINNYVPAWLQVYGNGADGACSPTTGNYSGEHWCTTFTLANGNTLTVNTNYGLVVHATGAIVIAGKITAAGAGSGGCGGGPAGGSGGGAAAGLAGQSSYLIASGTTGFAFSVGGAAGTSSGGQGASSNTSVLTTYSRAVLNSGCGSDGVGLGGNYGGAGGSAGGARGLGGGGVVFMGPSITGTDGTHTGFIDASGQNGTPAAANSTGSGSPGGGGVVILASGAAVSTWPDIADAPGAPAGAGTTTSIVPEALGVGGVGVTVEPVMTLGVTTGALNGTCTVITAGTSTATSTNAPADWTYIVTGGGGTLGTGTVVPVWSSGSVASCTATAGTSSGYTAATYTTSGTSGTATPGWYAKCVPGGCGVNN